MVGVVQYQSNTDIFDLPSSDTFHCSLRGWNATSEDIYVECLLDCTYRQA
jgi:hypothetical protein